MTKCVRHWIPVFNFPHNFILIFQDVTTSYSENQEESKQGKQQQINGCTVFLKSASNWSIDCVLLSGVVFLEGTKWQAIYSLMDQFREFPLKIALEAQILFGSSLRFSLSRTLKLRHGHAFWVHCARVQVQEFGHGGLRPESGVWFWELLGLLLTPEKIHSIYSPFSFCVFFPQSGQKGNNIPGARGGCTKLQKATKYKCSCKRKRICSGSACTCLRLSWLLNINQHIRGMSRMSLTTLIDQQGMNTRPWVPCAVNISWSIDTKMPSCNVNDLWSKGQKWQWWFYD